MFDHHLIDHMQSPLPPRFLPIPRQRRQQIAYHPRPSRLDLSRHRDARPQLPPPLLRIDPGAIQRNQRHIARLAPLDRLVIRLARPLPRRLLAKLFVRGARIPADTHDRTMQQPVARKAERLDLDLDRLADIHKPHFLSPLIESRKVHAPVAMIAAHLSLCLKIDC